MAHIVAPASVPASAQRVGVPLSVRQLNRLRIGYGVMGIGLLLTKWRLLPEVRHMELKEGTVVCMLVAMSALALLGLRHPRRMLPILLFEVAWKVVWLATVAVPLWADGSLQGTARAQAATVLLVAVVVAAIPWGYVFRQYGSGPGDAWRQPRKVAHPGDMDDDASLVTSM